MTTKSKPPAPANVIIVKPCCFGPPGCEADVLRCCKCSQPCWLSHMTKADAEALNEPYVLVCYECAKRLNLMEELVFGNRTLEALEQQAASDKHLN